MINLLACISLTGCSYSQRAEIINEPQAAIEESMQKNGSDKLFDRTQYLPSDWWTVFNDEQLSFFIQTAFSQNPTLYQAYANILLASANTDRLRANLFPNLFWGGES